MDDFVTPDVRIAEREVDEAYKSNVLIGIPFSSSAWHTLGVWEDYAFLRSGLASAQDVDAFFDNLKYYLKDALLWLRSSCPQGSVIPSMYDEQRYEAADSLLNLAHEYRAFARAMTLASMGYTRLSIDGARIVSTYDAPNELRLGAYDRLIRLVRGKEEGAALFDQKPITEYRDTIASSVRVRGQRFTITVNPRVVSRVMGWLSAARHSSSELPESWRFSRYAATDFERFFICISALAFIQIVGRHEAAGSGCIGLGFTDCLITMPVQGLVARARRYTGLAENVVLEIVSDLTYGSHEQERPDPALQPLIPLTQGVLAIAPHLVLTSAGERNLIPLMNRIREERPVYMRLTLEKEALMRNRIRRALTGEPLKLASGRVPGNDDLPDIDLAIIDKVHKACLLCELKWFVEPGEPREGIERSEEISKGVGQCLKLLSYFRAGNQDGADFLSIDSSYLVSAIVVSANSIGNASAQHPEIPVINEFHLLRKIKASGDLSVTLRWLEERDFLPRPNVHYEIVPTLSTVGKWSIEWYDFRIFDAEDFFAS